MLDAVCLWLMVIQVSLVIKGERKELKRKVVNEGVGLGLVS